MRGRLPMVGSQSSLREANRARIVDAVKQHGSLTQVELTEETGLSAATVSTIVKELVAAELVEVRNTVRSGRRAQLVRLAHRVGLVAGVVLGPRQLRVAVAGGSHEVLAEQTLPLPAEHRADTSLDRTALLVVDLLDRLGADPSELLGIGVAIPAPVDAASGRISVRGLMRGWDGVPVAQVLAKRLGRPVFVDSDANLGALAEATAGAARDVLDALYLRAGHGVRAGIVLGGRVHRGMAGTAGEIGHIQVDPVGDICGCGRRGCLDTVAGEAALLAPLRTSHGRLALRDVVRLAQEDDPGCRQIVADAATVIGGVLAGVATTLGAQVVVVGGELAESGEAFLGPLREVLNRQTLLHDAAGPVEVTPAAFGMAAELKGTLTLALQHTDVLVSAEESAARGEEEA